jgi:hypothetical protein
MMGPHHAQAHGRIGSLLHQSWLAGEEARAILLQLSKKEQADN